jgi:hypothetical protein
MTQYHTQNLDELLAVYDRLPRLIPILLGDSELYDGEGLPGQPPGIYLIASFRYNGDVYVCWQHVTDLASGIGSKMRWRMEMHGRPKYRGVVTGGWPLGSRLARPLAEAPVGEPGRVTCAA